MKRRLPWAVALVALLTAVAHTWPLATDPATLSLNYNGDVMLNEWIVAWVQHTLPRDPLHLFDANIFYPARDVLAFSEPLIVPALLGSPVRALGGSPVLVHNVLLLLGLALTMLGGYALVHHWTGDRWGALLAGTAWTFNAQSLVRLEHLQATHAYGIPLAILAADRLISTGERRHAWWLAAWMVVMAYSSGYLVIISAIALAVVLLMLVREWMPRPKPVLTGFLLAAVAAAVLVAPLYIPYRRAAIEQNMRRPLESVIDFSAKPDGYLASYSRVHDWLWNDGHRRGFEDTFFPGITVALLAVVGVTLRLRSNMGPGRRVPMLLALGTVGFILSLGTRTPVYGWLYDVFPLLAALRAAARFGVLFLLAMAVLAGIGVAALRHRFGHARWTSAAAVGLLVLVNLEAARAPFRYVEFQGISGLYRLLAQQAERVVLVEVPFYPPQAIFQNAEYVLNSTAHWRPLMNGYSGYTPMTYREYAEVFWYFPEPHTIDAMKAAGATHVMVHTERFGREGEDVLRRALADPRLERLAVGRNNMTLFRLR